MPKISALPEDTAPDSTDLITTVKASGSRRNKKITAETLSEFVSSHQGTIDARSYGADDAGSDDSTTYINLAIAAASASQTVKFPRGTYKIGALTAIDKPLVLDFDGSDIAPSTTGIVITVNRTSGTDTDRVVIKNANFIDGSADPANLVKIVSGDGTLLENVMVRGVTATHSLVWNLASYGLTIHNCRFHHNVAPSAIYLSDASDVSTYSYAFTFDKSDISNHTGVGITMQGGSPSIRDSVIESCSGGGIVLTGDSSTLPMSASGVYFEQNGSGVAAVGTITMSGIAVENETFVIDSQTFTWKTTRSTTGEVTLGATAAAAVTNIVSAITADLATVWSYDGTGNTVVVIAASAGTAGDSIVFTESSTNMSMDGSGTLGGTTAGSGGTADFDVSITGTSARQMVCFDSCRFTGYKSFNKIYIVDGMIGALTTRNTLFYYGGIAFSAKTALTNFDYHSENNQRYTYGAGWTYDEIKEADKDEFHWTRMGNRQTSSYTKGPARVGSLLIDGYSLTSGYKQEIYDGALMVNRPSATNDALSTGNSFKWGADGSLGSLNFDIKGNPSATATSRYVKLEAGDTLTYRPIVLNPTNGSVGIGTTVFGTNSGIYADKVLGIGNGTLTPQTVPANMVQIWSQDFLGTNGDARVHIMGEGSEAGRTILGSGKITGQGTTGGYTRQFAEANATLSGASTTIQTNVPSGSRLLGVQLRVDTAITGAGATTWTAAFVNVATTAICSGQAFTKNTKYSKCCADEIASGEVDITITPDAGTFTAGVIRAVVYYETYDTMADAS